MAVATVVVVVLALVLVRNLGSSTASSSPVVTGADRTPAVAPAAAVEALTTIAPSTFDRVGTNGEAAPFAVTSGQPLLGSKHRPGLVYEGAEFCPFCAADRYAIVAALARFGTFSDLRVTASGERDGNIPTFSFVNSSYASRYVSFAPYEAADRLAQPLQAVPKAVERLFVTYAGDPTTNTPSRFAAGRWQQPGIPFLDLGNRYVVSGASARLAEIAASGVLTKNDPGIVAIAEAIHHPASPLGKKITGAAFIADANYLSAAICSLDGGRPSAVCGAPGVRAAADALAAVRPIR